MRSGSDENAAQYAAEKVTVMKKIFLILLLLFILTGTVFAEDEYWSWGVQKFSPEEQQRIIEENDRFRSGLLSTPTPVPYTYKVTWKCVDATSFDGIANNDNKCTSSTGQVKYVSDSEAKKLDPKYKPGKSGAWYYNNK